MQSSEYSAAHSDRRGLGLSHITGFSYLLVFLNNTLLKESGLKTFSSFVRLVTGPNILKVISTDSFAHVTTINRNVILGTLAPNLLSMSPANGEVVISASGQLAVSGTSNEELSFVSINGNPFALAADWLAFSGSIDFGQSPGNKTLETKLIDLAGNEALSTSQFVLVTDQEIPIVSIPRPIPFITNLHAPVLGIGIEDLSAVTTSVFVNELKIFEGSEKAF